MLSFRPPKIAYWGNEPSSTQIALLLSWKPLGKVEASHHHGMQKRSNGQRPKIDFNIQGPDGSRVELIGRLWPFRLNLGKWSDEFWYIINNGHEIKYMYIILDLKHHPFRQPTTSSRICKHRWNLNLTRVNATGLGFPVSILFERAGFEDSYRRIANDILSSIFRITHVGLQLRFDNGDGLSGVSSWEEQGQPCDNFGENMKVPISPSSSTKNP